MWFIGGGGDEIPDGRWRASNGYVFAEKGKWNYQRVLLRQQGEAASQVERAARRIFFFFVGSVFLKGYLRFESGLERWARVRVACLSSFHCQTLTVPAFSSFRRFSGAL